ncbi:MAG: cell division protein SepF [Bacillota bacterium]|nr:cell division protein SepF [Bacillota bacterium]
MNLWEKILKTLGLLEEGDEEYVERELPRKTGIKGKVLDFRPSEAGYRLIVSNPHSFLESEEIGGHLKNKRPIVVNLEGMDSEEAKRTVDFLSGVIFALNGSSQKVSHQIFVFVPSGVTLNSDLHKGLKERDLLLNDTGEYFKDQ